MLFSVTAEEVKQDVHWKKARRKKNLRRGNSLLLLRECRLGGTRYLRTYEDDHAHEQ